MLTKSGLGALIAAVLLIAAGLFWHYAELATVGAGLAGLVIVSVIAVRVQQPARVSRQIPDPRAARGTSLYVNYVVTNPTRRRSPALSIVDELAGRTTVTAVPSIQKRDRNTIGAALPARRRGVFRVGPGQVERIDPFWFAVGRRQEIGREEVIIHPRVHRIDGPFGSLHSVAEEAITRSFASDPLSGFVSMREYVDGDDPRLIHWPTTARTGTLMVREHVELRRPEFTVVIDTASWVASPADFEEMVDVAASLAVHALRTGVHVRVGTTNRAFLGSDVPFRVDTDVLDFLTPLTQAAGGQNFDIGRVVEHGGSIGLIAFVTGPDGPSSQNPQLTDLQIIRIGQGAERGIGITSAASSAAQFAQGWR